MELFEKGSPKDLFMRGYSREDILQLTGFDIGNKGYAISKECHKSEKGASYCASFILANYTPQEIRSAIESHSNGASADDMLKTLGLQPLRGVRKIFELMGFGKEYQKSIIEYAKIKRAEAVKEKYGVDCVLSLKEIRKKGEATLMERYGVKNCSQSELIKQKKKETVRAHYGVDYSFFDADVRRRTEETNMKRYGVKSPFQSRVIRGKAQQTVKLRYGVDNPFQAEFVKEKIKDVMQSKYGVDNISQVPEKRVKAMETGKLRGSIKTLTEDSIYELLKSSFEDSDIVREYIDERYPYPCDFYIKSRDLFIEVNAHVSHGNRWFEGSDEDLAYVKKLKEKDGSMDRKILRTWARRDVDKRNRAKQEQLNYLVFWGKAAQQECREWIDLGMPDAKDWEKMYSWRSE